MMSVGEHIDTGKPLMIFEEAFGDDDGSLADLLSSLGDAFGDEISDVGKNSAISSYTGEIVDIRIHYNRDLKDYSPSCRKVIEDYINRYAERADVL